LGECAWNQRVGIKSGENRSTGEGRRAEISGGNNGLNNKLIAEKRNEKSGCAV